MRSQTTNGTVVDEEEVTVEEVTVEEVTVEEVGSSAVDDGVTTSPPLLHDDAKARTIISLATRDMTSA